MHCHKLLKNSDFRSDQKFTLSFTYTFAFVNEVSLLHSAANLSFNPLTVRTPDSKTLKLLTSKLLVISNGAEMTFYAQ